MHTILIDTGPAAGGGLRQALASSPMPRLSRLLRLAEMTHREPAREDAEAAWLSPAERWMCTSLGLQAAHAAGPGSAMAGAKPDPAQAAPAPQRAPWGALAALGAGQDLRGLAWGLALPVHLELGRESLSLADPADLQITPDEARALLETVQPLLRDAGWLLDARDPARWLVAHASLAEVVTADPSRAVGRNVASWMPAGTPARAWRQLLTEVQMLWQYHPVNEARLARGQCEVNTLWLHGCGSLPPDWRSPLRLAGEDDGMSDPALAAALRGLAVLPRAGAVAPLRVFDLRALLSQDPVQGLLALDARLSGAIAQALQQAGGVQLTLTGEKRWRTLQIRPLQAWKFWLRTDLPGMFSGL
ncbi:cofactor-independent phosphoglycerate mutase [mine drainage metagenome]|uniref:Cofactor-independent phosphoglycerate mutase n=1 Tax=mine drainage metagenome TaxID=410659 RepID=A0A1J5R4Y2_9ZZZZ